MVSQLSKIDLSQISGIGPYDKRTESEKTNSTPPSSRTIFTPKNCAHPFLILHEHTLELRSDQKLGQLLIQKYESVMRSRYFGKQGIEIVPSGQLTPEELSDLIRLSYNLSLELS